MEDFSIDQTKLPGVKMVCRDFAVLEDHSLAHSLQEQEIESHLASNIHKSRLVQQDLQVAKRLQEEEDLRARAGVRKRQKDIERNDSEIAQEIQEQLVRQAERQREQEEKDAAIARKLQEREQLKEERRRKKYQDAAYEESCYEEKGGRNGRLQSELQDTTQGLSELDLREQEVRDMEVARRLQEQELKARNLDKRAAQVAQDEEIARLMMEEEEMMYKKSRDRERKRQEEDWRPGTDDAVKPRSGQEEYEQHRSRHQKPARPPAPLHEYENVRPTYPEPSCSPQFSARPNATNRGYYRQ